MGRTPKERALRRAGSDLLRKLQGKEGHIRLTSERREELLEDLGTSPENVETLMSVQEPDIIDELFPFGEPKPPEAPPKPFRFYPERG